MLSPAAPTAAPTRGLTASHQNLPHGPACPANLRPILGDTPAICGRVAAACLRLIIAYRSTEGAKMRGRSDISIRDLVERGLLQPGEELMLGVRGLARATVTNAGTLKMNGEEYRSPTMAANAASGTNLNGWKAWRLTRGDRVIELDALRQEARQRR